MKRNNLGNEIIVALITIAMLALAFTFGVVLTVTRITGTSEVIQSLPKSTLTATRRRTLPLTALVVLPTARPSSTATPSLPRSTNTQTYTSTPTNTETLTSTPTNTQTPTATSTATYTPTPSFTLTSTSTATLTNMPSLTNTSTATPTITPTATITLTPTATITAISCLGLPGWVPYTIRRGDTLSRISLQAGIGLTTLLQANCLTASTVIYPGQVVFVPPGRMASQTLYSGPCDQFSTQFNVTMPNLHSYRIVVQCINGTLQITSVFP